MFNSFSIALSGLLGTSTGIDVIGNNLANMNTTGFKGSTISFEEMVASLAAAQPGAGTAAPNIMRQYLQGSIQNTGNPLNAGIQGQGFFVVNSRSGGQTLYTRDGNFQLDANGNLLSSSGDYVQGWAAVNGLVNPTGATTNLAVPLTALSAPTATTKMSFSANLNAGAAKGDTFSAPIQVMDSLGNTHVLTVTFTNAGSGSWSYAVSIPGEDLKSGTAGTPSAISGATGNLTFDSTGKLTSPASTAAPVSIKVTGLADGAADLNVAWSLFGTDGSPALTQFAQTSAISGSTQDGVAAGQITGVQIANGGLLTAQYSNGKSQVIGQLALAGIGNPESMIAVGGNELALGANTAQPVVGAADSGGRGQIVGSALEASTVDMATEFTNLIVMERSYEANAKVITTTDQLTQDTVNLLR